MNVLLRAFISFEELGNGSNDLDQTFYADIFGGNISIKLSVITWKKNTFSILYPKPISFSRVLMSNEFKTYIFLNKGIRNAKGSKQRKILRVFTSREGKGRPASIIT